MAAMAVQLEGCENVENTMNSIGGGVSSVTDDGTACYADQRVSFYQSVDAVEEANHTVFGARILSLTANVVNRYFTSTLSQQLAQSFTKAMTQVEKDVEADHSRILAVTDSFDRLMECRMREARTVRAAYHSRKLDHDTAADRLATLNRLDVADIDAADRVNAVLRQRNEAFSLSADRIEQEAPPAESHKESSQRRREVSRTKQAVQTNQHALAQQEASVKKAEQLKDEPFTLSLLIWLRSWSGSGRPT